MQPPEWIQVLKDYAPVAQVVAYVILTLASVVVASVQFALARRQNYGWRPVLFLRYSEHVTIHPGDVPYVSFGFEVWNRRRYPILVRDVFVSTENMSFHGVPPDQPIGNFWQLGNKTLVASDEFVIEPASHIAHELALPLPLPPSGTVREKISIKVNYFDPRLKRDVTLDSQTRVRT